MLTGYAPFHDGQGVVRGMVGVDVDASQVTAQLSRLRRDSITLSVAAALVVAGTLGVVLWLVGRLRAHELSRLRAELALGQREEDLRQGSKMEAVGRLAGGVAHEFNDLLTVVRGRSELLLNGLDRDDRRRGQVDVLLATVERATQLTQQLLAVSGRQVRRPELLDLNAVLGGMEAMLRRLVGERIELVLALAAELGRISADPRQLEQVVLNLVVNARDAMPEGGRVTLETGNIMVGQGQDAAGDDVRPGVYVRLTVTDTGAGLDTEARTRLFEPFFTSRGPEGGRGLGLASVYGVVRQSRGHLLVTSEPGRGSRLEIYLPRVDGPLEPPLAALNGGRRAGEHATILLVEDEDGVRQLVAEILLARGWTVLQARGLDEALLFFEARSRQIDLLITDVALPGTSGPELAERLAAQAPDLKVLYISSGYRDERRVTPAALGPDVALLHKPFSPQDLIRWVSGLLGDARRPFFDGTPPRSGPDAGPG